jgi:Domain of unknown function (DUF4335)
MSSSNSVIRRYTPPTCTLEIWAENSPLSRWTDQTIIKNLKFRLQFDDPRLSEERKILIQGDYQKLELLSNIVTTYVQKLLQQSAEDFSINLLDTNNANTESELQDTASSVLSTQTSFNTQIPQTKIYLEASSNLTHKLFMSDLAEQVIELTLLQLFDLATALDEYSSDLTALPTANNQSVSISLPQWSPIAAVLVIAGALTPFTWQYAKNFQPNKSQVAKNTNPTSTQVAIAPSSTLNLPTPQLTPPVTNFSPSLSFPNAIIPAQPTTLPQATSIPSNTTSYPITPQVPLTPLFPNTNIGSVTQRIPNSRNLVAKSGINTTSPKNSSSSNKTPSNLTINSPSIATIPNNIDNNNSNPLPASSDSELQRGMTGIPAPEQISQKEKNDNLVRRLRAAKNAPVTAPNDDKTLFDTPQVVEAREYLNKRWQPPSGLSQPLEYSLLLGVDGTIERILPLNQVSREYIDSSGIPEIGKPFVSTNKSGQNLRIRVVLGADSKVQTFPETP